MARRSSARLRSHNSSTPKRVSLSHDAQVQTPRTAPVKLSTLAESDEMPGAFPSSASPPDRSTMTDAGKQKSKMSFLSFGNVTPKNTTPVKPAQEEMHPQQQYQNTAKPLEEVRWLGFSSMHPQTEPPRHSTKLGNLQTTPSKASGTASSIQPAKYQFAFTREQSLELSPAAKRLMEETREEAARIREQMMATDEAAQDGNDVAARKIATPKGRKGRFSDAHKAEFKKMDSIASHPSVRRALPEVPLNISVNTPGQKSSQSNMLQASPSKSLKRKQSHAELDEPDRYPKHNITPGPHKSTPTHATSQLPRALSTNNLMSPSKLETMSSVKRMKFAAPTKASAERSQPSTPQSSNTTPRQPHYPDLTNLASPTQASLARSASVKSVTSKIPAPSLIRSPSKPILQSEIANAAETTTPLLTRSPSKAALFEHAAIEIPKTKASPLLMRSPVRAVPTRKSPVDDTDNAPIQVKQVPLLARSPLKVSTTKSAEPINDNLASTTSPPKRLLLQQSPSKIAMPKLDNNDSTSGTPRKALEGGLLGRFNLLRSSPMKSILRSPQRLYSNDPAKVAAGTHLATPPKFKVAGNGQTMNSAQKRVDFSSSTKARYERAQSELSSTPSKGSSPSPSPSPSKQTTSATSPARTFGAYPTLPTEVGENIIVTPHKRCQTAVPGDFTFKAGEHGITFSTSPNAPVSGSSKRPSTIRHVSAEPVLLSQATGSKKRKFDYESNLAASAEESKEIGEASDKENEENERPAKRMKKSTSEPPTASANPKPTVTKRPTLGVKLKKSESGDAKEKKPSVISRARLAALSQPKRRA